MSHGGRWPRVEVLGVYPVPQYPDTHVIELIIHAPRWRVEASEFRQHPGWTQEGPDGIGFDEHYLTPDGELVIPGWLMGDRNAPIPEQMRSWETTPTRIAFFMLHCNPAGRLLTPAGWRTLPGATPILERLLKQMAFDF